jgi:hypothetical protein
MEISGGSIVRGVIADGALNVTPQFTADWQYCESQVSNQLTESGHFAKTPFCEIHALAEAVNSKAGDERCRDAHS